MTFEGDCNYDDRNNEDNGVHYNEIIELSHYLSNLQSQPPDLEGWGGVALQTATKQFIDSSEIDKEYIEYIGKVQYMDFEGGFWSVLSSKSNFIPVNLQNTLHHYDGQTVKIKGFINPNIIRCVYKWGTLIFVDVIMTHKPRAPYCKNISNTPILPLPEEDVLLDASVVHCSTLPLYYAWSFVPGEYIKNPDEYILISGYNKNNKSIITSFTSFPVNIMLEMQNEEGQVTRVYKNIYQNISLEPEHEQSPSLENTNRETLKKYYDEILYMYSDAAALAGHRRFEHDHFWVDQ